MGPLLKFTPCRPLIKKKEKEKKREKKEEEEEKTEKKKRTPPHPSRDAGAEAVPVRAPAAAQEHGPCKAGAEHLSRAELGARKLKWQLLGGGEFLLR